MCWIFQLMDGIHYVAMNINGVIQKTIQGWTDLKQKIIRLMGKPIMQIYNLADNVDFSSEGSSMRGIYESSHDINHTTHL